MLRNIWTSSMLLKRQAAMELLTMLSPQATKAWIARFRIRAIEIDASLGHWEISLAMKTALLF